MFTPVRKLLFPIVSAFTLNTTISTAQVINQPKLTELTLPTVGDRVNDLKPPLGYSAPNFFKHYLEEDALKETINSALGVITALIAAGIIAKGTSLLRTRRLYRGKMSDYFTISVNYFSEDEHGKRKLNIIKMNSAWANELFGKYQTLEKRLTKLIKKSMKDGKILVPVDFNQQEMRPIKEILEDFVKKTFAPLAFTKNAEPLVAFLTCDDTQVRADRFGIIHPSIQVIPLKDLKVFSEQRDNLDIYFQAIDMSNNESKELLKRKLRLYEEILQTYMSISDSSSRRGVRVTMLKADLGTYS